MPRVKRLTNIPEETVLVTLETSLQETSYRVTSKNVLADVIEFAPNEEPTPEDRNFLRMAHFDFVVWDRVKDGAPVFALGFDGPPHDTEKQQARDVRKNRLCYGAGLALLRIGYLEISEYEKTSLLEFIVRRFVAFHTEHAALLEETEKALREATPEQYEMLTEGHTLDPSIDPTFIFDLRHPFPGIKAVRDRLRERYGITSTMTPQNMGASKTAIGRIMKVLTLPGAERFGDDHDHQVEVTFTLYWEDPKIAVLHWEGGHLVSPGVEILLEGRVAAKMRWTYPIEPDNSVSETYFDYFDRTGRPPFMFGGIPGMDTPSIAHWFAEYLALRKVEEWAETNLQPRSLMPDS